MSEQPTMKNYVIACALALQAYHGINGRCFDEECTVCPIIRKIGDMSDDGTLDSDLKVIALEKELTRHGFVRCDIPACNCGGWHARYGLKERMDEMISAIEEAGYALSNRNGNLPLNALKDLIADLNEYKYRP